MRGWHQCGGLTLSCSENEAEKHPCQPCGQDGFLIYGRATRCTATCLHCCHPASAPSCYGFRGSYHTRGICETVALPYTDQRTPTSIPPLAWSEIGRLYELRYSNIRTIHSVAPLNCTGGRNPQSPLPLGHIIVVSVRRVLADRTLYCQVRPHSWAQ